VTNTSVTTKQTSRTSVLASLPLRGGGGEPVLLARTLNSHGVAALPPSRIDETSWTLEVTLPVPRGARTVRVSPGRRGSAQVELLAGSAPPRIRDAVLEQLRHMFRLDEDLSGFYAIAQKDTELAWAATGAGRMLRSPTVFEDVVKTICTTNCAWSGTVRMVTALVDHLGIPAPGTKLRTFPTPAAMAEAKEGFYRDVARAGYRGAYLRRLADDVASGALDLEELNDAELSDEEIEARLLALPGVGPYAAAHVMLTSLGRYSRLVLDSWTRPTYAKLAGRKLVADKTIERHFKRYGPFAGLAFWLLLTRGWVPEYARDEGPDLPKGRVERLRRAY
jgi:3-methyladenine DNA glycosylase/8-oxoguanine DNA glycosylase